MRKTPAKNPNYQLLTTAFNGVVEIGEHINEVKGHTETIRAINDLKNTVKNFKTSDDLLTFGLLLKDGDIQIRRKTRYMFLFDKVALICKRKGDGLKYKELVYLTKHKLEGNENDILLVNLSDGGSVQLSAKKQEHQDWMKAFQNAYERTTPCSTEKGFYPLISIANSTVCSSCNTLSKGCYYQAYLCVFTGKVFHASCIPELTASYPWFAGKAERVPAVDLLTDKPDGTYLVRHTDDGLRLSIIFQSKAWHLKIECHERMLYITPTEQFKTVKELLGNYRRKPLSEANLGNLDTTLKLPYNHAGQLLYTALYDCKATTKGMLSIQQDDVLVFLEDVKGDANWISGENWEGDRGIFARNFVRKMR